MVWGYTVIGIAILFFLFSFAIPNSVVLGNNLMYPIVSGILAALLVTIVLKATASILSGQRRFFDSSVTQILINGLVATVAIWIIARAAVYSGFGLSSFLYAVILGFVISILHYFIYEYAGKEKR